MLNHVRQQLVKPGVDPVDLERLAEVPRGVEQQLSGLGFSAEVSFDALVVRYYVVRFVVHRHPGLTVSPSPHPSLGRA